MNKTRLALLGMALAGIVLATPQARASEDLAKKNGCSACHNATKKVVGPAWHDVAAKYKGDASAPEHLAAKVKAGGKGNWGTVPMPPQTKVGDADLKTLITWVLSQ